MTTTDPITASSSEDLPAGTPEDSQTDAPPPWLLRIFCLLLATLPTSLVLPGALKGNGAPVRMMALIMFGLAVLGFLMLRRTTHARRVNPGVVIILVYLALWFAAYGVGLLNNDDYVVASSRTRSFVAMIAHVGIVLYILARIHTARQRHILLGYLAAGLAFACLTAFLQGVSSIDLRLFVRPPGFVVNIDDLQTTARLGVARVTGTSQHPIEFSVLAAVTVPLMIYFVRNAATRRVRIICCAAGGIALMALPASISRSGIIALAAALLVNMFAFKLRPIITVAIGGVVAVGGYIVMFPNVANALWSTITGSAQDASIESRLQDYTRVSALLRERPFFGLGLGGSPPAAFGFLDNEWLQALVQGGIVGLTAMTLFAGGAIFGMAAALRRASSQQEREQAYLLGGMATAILASSFTFDLFGFEQAAVLTFLVFALLWSGFTVAVPEPKDQLTARINGEV